MMSECIICKCWLSGKNRCESCDPSGKIIGWNLHVPMTDQEKLDRKKLLESWIEKIQKVG